MKCQTPHHGWPTSQFPPAAQVTWAWRMPSLRLSVFEPAGCSVMPRWFVSQRSARPRGDSAISMPPVEGYG